MHPIRTLFYSTAVILASLIAIATLTLSRVDLSNLVIAPTINLQVDWPAASARCNKLGDEWRLASISELVALFYLSDRIDHIENTDIWSNQSLLGYVFGLNTHAGILSFDTPTDTDHYICVHNRKRPA